MNIATTNEGILINEKFFFSNWQPADWKINLFSKIWADLAVEHKNFIIDYPGEYEKDWYFIQVEVVNDELNYLVVWEDGFAILQQEKALEDMHLEKVQDFFYTHEAIKTKLESMELQGDFHSISL